MLLNFSFYQEMLATFKPQSCLRRHPPRPGIPEAFLQEAFLGLWFLEAGVGGGIHLATMLKEHLENFAQFAVTGADMHRDRGGCEAFPPLQGTPKHRPLL